jgi:pimeloyl-ACP methyl ester carboxylesterase
MRKKDYNMKKQRVGAALFFCAAISFFSRNSAADTYTFTSIAETGSGFNSFDSPTQTPDLYGPSINNLGSVAFWGTGNVKGIYAGDGTSTQFIASSEFGNNLAMNKSGTVTYLNDGGIYLAGKGATGTTIAAFYTPDQFTGFSGPPSINTTGTVAFYARQGTSTDEMRVGTAAGTTIVASTSGPYTQFFGSPAVNDSGTIVFAGQDASGQAVYTSTAGKSTPIIRDTQGGAFDRGYFLGAFGMNIADAGPVINNAGTIASVARFTNGVEGVITVSKLGNVQQVVGPGSPLSVLGGTGVSLNNNGAVAFESSGSSLYAGTNPQSNRVIGVGDKLLGSTITQVGISRTALNDFGQLTFKVSLANGRQAIIRADPTSLPQVATTAAPPAQYTQTYATSAQNLLVFNGQTFQAGQINRLAPTVVLTHGFADTPQLWNSADSQFFASALRSVNPGVNIVAWDWSKDADTGNLPLSASRAANEGKALGDALYATLGPQYSNSIHFMGHSLGTLVNSKAIDVFHSDSPLVRIQDTIFDEASTANSFVSPWQYPVNPIPKSPIASIENYVSAFGTLHPEALNVILQHNPSETLSKDDIEYWNVFHQYPYQWYAKTMTTTPTGLIGYAGAIENAGPTPAYQADNYYLQSANGGELQLFQVPANVAVDNLTSRNAEQLNILKNAQANPIVNYYANQRSLKTFNLTVSQLEGAIQTENDALATYDLSGPLLAASPQITLIKRPQGPTAAGGVAHLSSISSSSSYAWVPFTIPADAQYLSLDFTFHGLSANDLFTVGMNDFSLFQLEDQFAADGVRQNTGLLEVSQWSGKSVQLFLGLVSSDDSNAGGSIELDNITFVSVPEPSGPLFLVLLGTASFLCARNNRGDSLPTFRGRQRRGS